MMASQNRAAPCLLHTMVRVRDLQISLDFYCGLLGMRELRRIEFTAARFSLVYIGYDDDREGTVLELTWNWDQMEPYSHGSGYGHIGIGVAHLEDCCAGLAAAGVSILRAPGEMMATGIRIAFIEDPDGYRIELIEMPFPLLDMGSRTTHP